MTSFYGRGPGGGSGVGGTSNYNDLENKPKINNVQLIDNISLDAIGAQENLKSGENIKTINGESVLGEGDIEITINSEEIVKISNEPPDESERALIFINLEEEVKEVKAVLYDTDQALTAEEKEKARRNINAVENMTIKTTLDSMLLETNTEYQVESSTDITIDDAIGWGIINITATADFTLTIPASHKWANGLDGFIEADTAVMVLYDNGRWSRIDWR